MNQPDWEAHRNNIRTQKIRLENAKQSNAGNLEYQNDVKAAQMQKSLQTLPLEIFFS